MAEENKNLENQKEKEKKEIDGKRTLVQIIGWFLVIGNGAASILLYFLDKSIDTMTSGIIYYGYTRYLGFPLIIIGLFLICWGKIRFREKILNVIFNLVIIIICLFILVQFSFLKFRIPSTPLTEETPTARERAINSKVEFDMKRIGSEAERIYESEGNYINVTCAYDNFKDICDGIEKITERKPTIHAAQNKYCAYIKFVASKEWYCIDTSGQSGGTIRDPSISGYCDGTTFICPFVE